MNNQNPRLRGDFLDQLNFSQTAADLFEEALGGEKAWLPKEFLAERQRAVSAGETEPRFRKEVKAALIPS